jgi:mannose-6-phosphate isomerase-like protein (cupin superfamily)
MRPGLCVIVWHIYMASSPHRPWGHYRVHASTPTWTLKTLYVKPNQQLSIQWHKLRDETWFLVEGGGKVGVGSPTKWISLKKGKSVHIPRKTIHSLRAGSKGLVVVEVMTGKYKEDDIVRLSDIYGRQTEK